MEEVQILMFLLYGRANETKISEFLRDAWANDRRAEWSIWMVYSKVDMPHQYISSGFDDSFHDAHGKASALRKLNGDVIDENLLLTCFIMTCHKILFYP